MILAYLDPGTGSLILQAVLGGVAGILVAARAFKAKLLGRKTAGQATQEESLDESATTGDS